MACFRRESFLFSRRPFMRIIISLFIFNFEKSFYDSDSDRNSSHQKYKNINKSENRLSKYQIKSPWTIICVEILLKKLLFPQTWRSLFRLLFTIWPHIFPLFHRKWEEFRVLPECLLLRNMFGGRAYTQPLKLLRCFHKVTQFSSNISKIPINLHWPTLFKIIKKQKWLKMPEKKKSYLYF